MKKTTYQQKLELFLKFRKILFPNDSIINNNFYENSIKLFNILDDNENYYYTFSSRGTGKTTSYLLYILSTILTENRNAVFIADKVGNFFFIKKKLLDILKQIMPNDYQVIGNDDIRFLNNCTIKVLTANNNCYALSGLDKNTIIFGEVQNDNKLLEEIIDSSYDYKMINL